MRWHQTAECLGDLARLGSGTHQSGQHVAPIGGHYGGDCGVHPVDTAQRGFHIPEFDTEAADLDSMVGTSDEFDDAAGPIAHQVASAVPPAAAVLDESFGREDGASGVAPGYAAAAHPQFAGNPVGAILTVGTHHAALVVGQRHAQGHRGPVGGDFSDVADGVVRGGFGGPAQTRETHVRSAFS